MLGRNRRSEDYGTREAWCLGGCKTREENIVGEELGYKHAIGKRIPMFGNEWMLEVFRRNRNDHMMTKQATVDKSQALM